MMGILVPAAFLGLLVVLAVFLFQRREALDLTPRGLLGGYLYLASLAGIVTLSIGLAALTSFGLAQGFGTDVIYGGPPPRMAVAPAIQRCPPGETRCVDPSPEQLEAQRRSEKEQLERRRAEDLLRGATFTVFGALVWAAHWAARRGLGVDEAGSGLRRAYLTLGTVVFGLVTVIMLPAGVFQALSAAILPVSEQTYRQPADSLGGGLAALPIWLAFLWLFLKELRGPGARRADRPPLEPVGIGAALIRPPDTRSAGAAAIPPEER